MTALAAIADVAYSDTALELDQRMTFERWSEVGSLLGRVHRASKLWLGDWLNFGEHAYGEKYAQAIDVTGLDYSTLANYAYVSRQIDPSRRREGLSFSVHAEVAALPPAAQDVWLDRAEREGLGSRDLRRALKDSRGVESFERFSVRVPASVAAAVRERAQGRPLGEVAARLLHEYAEGES